MDTFGLNFNKEGRVDNEQRKAFEQGKRDKLLGRTHLEGKYRPGEPGHESWFRGWCSIVTVIAYDKRARLLDSGKTEPHEGSVTSE
jgi:hypothetical protein